MYRCSSPYDEEEVARLTRAQMAESTDCGCEEAWDIVKRAGICIWHTGSGIRGGSIKGVSGYGKKMLSTSSIIRSYARGSTFGGIGEPPLRGLGLTAVVSSNCCKGYFWWEKICADR